MSPESAENSTSDVVVCAAGQEGRPILFADLRPDVVEVFRDSENDVERTEVALAIEETEALASWGIKC